MDSSITQNFETDMSNNQSLGTIAAVTATTIAFGGAALYLKSSSTKESKDEKLAASRAKYAAESWEDHVASRHGALQEICPGVLYVLEASGCNMGPPTRNMVIFRVPAAKSAKHNKENPLIIYNAVAVDEKTMKEIEAMGKPTVLIVPNCHQYFRNFHKAYQNLTTCLQIFLKVHYMPSTFLK